MKAPRETAYRLPLIFCKLASAKRSRRRAGTPMEAGFSLQVALLSAFVLLIGITALAARTNSGFFGAVYQESNRDARDVAESAIAEFANTMNREQNRYLLTAGATNTWNDATNRNPCTQFNADGSIIDTDGDGVKDAATPVNAAVITRFTPSPDVFQNLVGNDATRRFRLESVEYRRADRTVFTPADTAFISDIRNGGNRTLIRITVVGEVNQGGRVSTARIAKEFEVVPKCCKRSFGRNAIGAVNWGRDSSVCLVRGPGGGNGFIVGMNGGGIDGSGNEKKIYDENGVLLTQALCWDGNQSGVPSDLSGTANPTCTNNDMALGDPSNPSNTGISFSPTEFSWQYPVYSNPAGNPGFNTLTIANNQERYITYYNDGVNPSGIRLCSLSGGNYTGCTRIDGTAVVGNVNPDPCYSVSSLDTSAIPPRPFHRYNCQLQNIVLSNPNSELKFDTTYAQINMMFYNPSYTGLLMGGAGTREISRVQCTQSGASTQTLGCSTPITWTTFREDCALTDCEGLYYDNKRLLNIYANGAGSFNLWGDTAGVGFNLYAPLASTVLRGGGNSNPNFMGQIWVNDAFITGNTKIQTFSSGPGEQGPPTFGNPIVDSKARSFTQSSGFGL